jgi:hypothetical protein
VNTLDQGITAGRHSKLIVVIKPGRPELTITVGQHLVFTVAGLMIRKNIEALSPQEVTDSGGAIKKSYYA